MRWATAFLMLGVFAFSGCGNEKGGVSTSEYEANKPKILAAARANPAGNAPAAAAAPQPEAEEMVQATMGTGYSYDATDKRDPFRSFILDQAKEAADREIGPLEQFDISQLKVVGVLWDTGLPIALVADPSGRPYVVNEGSAMGKNDGRVIKIDDGMVLVKETYVDWLGEKTTKDIEMRLAGGDKGGDLR